MKKLESILDLKLRNFLPLFHKALQQSTYCGLPILKNPLDLFIYQEIIYRTKPDIIIEIGTYKGGSAKYLKHFLNTIHEDIYGNLLITIDPECRTNIEKDGIFYTKGKPIDRKTTEDINYII